MIVSDPLGNEISLVPDICIIQQETAETKMNDVDSEIYDDIATVIRKPAIMVESETGGQTKLYYFRSVGWQKTLLIEVKYHNNHWEAYQCTWNPSNQQLSDVLKKGKQLI